MLRILDVEQRARGFLRQSARHRLVDEVDDLCLHRCLADGGRRMPRLLLRQSQRLGGGVRETLRLVSPIDHDLAHDIDDPGVGRVQKQHAGEHARIEFALALQAQEVAHRDRHVAEVDIDRAGIQALVAHRAVIGDVAEFVEMFERDAAPRLLFVKEGLDQQARGEDLVARTVKQVGARHVRCAHRLAFAAAQAVLDRIGDPPMSECSRIRLSVPSSAKLGV